MLHGIKARHTTPSSPSHLSAAQLDNILSNMFAKIASIVLVAAAAANAISIDSCIISCSSAAATAAGCSS